MIDISKFIADNITCRQQSLFIHDMEENKSRFSDEITGSSVLVIGGAGSIGSSYIRTLLRYKPRKLVVVDISENGLTELTRDLRSTHGLFVPDEYLTYPVNFANPVFEQLFRKEKGFDIVANFSAHKHVRSEKDVFSVKALLENNVLKARYLMDLLTLYPPRRFFCVSTDKAANPVNIMGCSKKVMEEMIMTYSAQFKVSTARFANVAFSNGSLLAGFVERMMKRQPLSAPEDVRRYFVSPEESGQICFMANILGNSREIFFPKLEKSQMMAFSTIADAFVKSLGYTPYRCSSEEEAKSFAAEIKAGSKEYPVYYFHSDTTGEKETEEFYMQDEPVNLNRFESLGVIEEYPCKSPAEMEKFLSSLTALFYNSDVSKNDIVLLLKSFIPSFSHIEKGKNLDQKM
ncbi:MAG: UDP-N-acetylglucosamine 4,6-dehydratase [Tannerella sp.]|jgi:FlaA1/EpsC-like NDP-sugar epimerase|nr:UDP-N-acetylglucosamine 4,6-dehydratase [Tannerella sp.]